MKKNRILFLITVIIAAIFYVFTKVDFAAFFLGFCVAYLLGSGLIILGAGNMISWHFSSDRETSQGEEEKATLYVENESIMAVPLLLVKLKCENLLTGEEETITKSLSLGPKRKREEELQVGDVNCGAIRIWAEEVKVTDPLGIFGKAIKPREKNNQETKVFVFPNVSPLPIEKDQLDRYDMESYRYSQSRKGNDPSETFGLKNYEAGDSIKAIHWKLSEKVGDVILREYGLPVDNRVGVICDKRDIEGMSSKDKSSVTELFLSTLYTLADKGLNHSAFWYDYRREEYVSKSITGVEDVYGLMPELLASPYKEDKLSSADRFLEADTDKNYGSYIYVTGNSQLAEKEIEGLEYYGEVNIYRPENFK